ncbi:MAG: pyridine nucleotide-disulfide oxidoreductase, partial [Gammaproteobacteria bacterium]
ERYRALGVDCINGRARITSPYSVEVDGRTLTTRSIIVATGGSPFVPPIEGIEKTGYLTSDTVWQVRELPKRLVVLGGGPIGSELSQAFARLGSQVTQVEMLPRILMREDPEVTALVSEQFKTDGINVLTAHQARRCELNDGQKVLVCDSGGEEVRLEFDELLVAVGRKSVTDSCGLEELGIDTTAAGTVKVNEYMQTKFPNIFACGDVAGPYQFTHVAAHQAWYATVNALLGGLWRVRADYSVIPWATFTDPEVARVGLNEQEAKEQNIPHEITTFPLADLDRAIAESETRGLVKVLTRPGKDRILGATIVGEHAGDLITEFVTAMRNGLGLNKVLGTIHIYPTLAEANKFAAGNWKRAHTSARTLRWIKRYLSWQRG